MVFLNPSRNLSNIYVQKQAMEEIGSLNDSFEEVGFSPDSVESYLDEMDAAEYIDQVEPVVIDEDVEIAEEIDSFTAPEILSGEIENSGIAEIHADLDEGVYSIRTYRSREDEDGWTFWMPYLDESSATVVGKASPPYQDRAETFSYSGRETPDLDTWMQEDILDTAYILARETVPNAPQYAFEKDEVYFQSKFDEYEGKLNMISRLEETGELEIDPDQKLTSNGARGGNLVENFRNFLNLAKKGRLIDYTVSNRNKENVIEIDSGGYKFLTGQAEEYGFGSTDEMIESRLVPQWQSS